MIDPGEPVWREDVTAQKDTTEALWKTQYSYVCRLQNQEAPEAMLEKMIMVNNYYKLAHEILEELEPYFPEEPQYGGQTS